MLMDREKSSYASSAGVEWQLIVFLSPVHGPDQSPAFKFKVAAQALSDWQLHLLLDCRQCFSDNMRGAYSHPGPTILYSEKLNSEAVLCPTTAALHVCTVRIL